MKNHRKFMVGILLVVFIVAAYFIGGHITEKKLNAERTVRCGTLITFAIDKAENEDLTDQSVINALISNVYAAYQFCDDNQSANQLYDLWNSLIFENDSNIDDIKENVLRELHAVLRSIKASE